MMHLLRGAALLAIAVLMATPADARHRHHHRHVHLAPLVSYLHNYGPGPFPGTYAYYDGPLRANCKRGAAAYRGQDGRAHPCL
jgi:hypothetical protein